MALEMQIAPTMKLAFAAILSLVFVTGPAALAEESSCVKSFRKANAEYSKTHAEIVRRQGMQSTVPAESKIGAGTEYKVGAAIVAAAGVGCLVLRRKSIPGILICSAAVMASAIPYNYGNVLADRIERQYDAHRLYNAYSDAVADDIENSEAAKEFVKELNGTDPNPKAVMKEFVGLMENGALCEGERPFSYQEALDLMKARLQVVTN